MTVIVALRGWSGNQLPFPISKGAGGASSGETMAGRDFLALNKAAIQAGLTTAPENYTFRATHDVRRKVKTAEESKKGTSRRLPPTMVFGVSTRYMEVAFTSSGVVANATNMTRSRHTVV